MPTDSVGRFGHPDWLSLGCRFAASRLRHLRHSSIFEGVSLTILEAMAAGVPVVATKVGGTPEVVVDGETGRLVPARNAPAMADALLHLATEPESAKRFAANGRRRVEQNFSIEAMVENYAEVYREFRRGRNKPGP